MSFSYAFSHLKYTRSSGVLHVAVAVSVKRGHLFICRGRFSETLTLHRRTKLSSQSHEMSPQMTSIIAVLSWH